MTKYLAKANDDVLSFCRCEAALAATPGQADCPWCGCGWLFACHKCRKSFTFARVVDVDATYEEIVRQDTDRRGSDLSREEVAEDANWLAAEMEPLSLGETVVYLDGKFIPLTRAPVVFEGLYAKHALPILPHASALSAGPDALRDVLGEAQYWFQRERSDRLDHD